MNKILLVGLLLLFARGFCDAQSADVFKARQYYSERKIDKALEVYKELYGVNPDSIFNEYLNVLVAEKKYKAAEKLIENRINEIQNPGLYIDLGYVYQKDGKEGKAKEWFDKAVMRVNGDDILTKNIANKFLGFEKTDYAIRTFERATEILMNPDIYQETIANLYAKNGELDKAIELIILSPRIGNIDHTKTMLLQLLGNDENKLVPAQKLLIKKLNEQPENLYFADLLTWVYIQKNDWDGALMQLIAVDERIKENGKRLLDFAHLATSLKQFDAADKAFEEIISRGSDKPYYGVAKSEKLANGLNRLKNSPKTSKGSVDTLEAQFDNFFTEFPRYYATNTASDFAMVEAQYAGNPAKAIDILKTAVARPDIARNLVGTFKLQMGDYYLLEGKIWDASLTYSQVDKEFKQDVMGEDARFRNAKLAYYRGDFAWAQRQLLVLKSATSELIANDAIYLSVLITENVEDSITLPLQRFAYADLLLSENKEAEGLKILDSLAENFPKHPLNDDILFLRAKLAEKHQDYEKAITFLERIYKEYSTDVLADDAIFKIAEIYQNNLLNTERARHYYEQLIIDYPGSTFVQTARQRLYELNHAKMP